MICRAMPSLHAYPKPQVPREVALQVRSYVRIQWPHLDELIGPRLWDVPPDSPARTFVVLDGEKLVSHAEANFRPVDHAGATFNVGGLSAVFTYPAYRRGGFAQQVVRAASEFLDASDADLALLFCGEPRRGFYASLGWEALNEACIHYGDRANPKRHEGTIVMARFISPRGRAARQPFEREAVYVGQRTW
jgi:GNAT superfamily N-acetyltransferase